MGRVDTESVFRVRNGDIGDEKTSWHLDDGCGADDGICVAHWELAKWNI
jgi:hypothetical protein